MLIGFDMMTRELARHGIEAEYKYDRGRDLYTIIAKKDGAWVSRKIAPYDINRTDEFFNAKRRGVVNSIIKAFEKKESDEEWITVSDMVDILRSKGFAVATWEERNSAGKHETIFMVSRKGHALRRILYEYDIGGIAEIQKHRRYFIDEIVEAFEREENSKLDVASLYPKQLYISTAGYRPHTIFEDFIKEKEKEMGNNIKWKVANITVDNRERTPVLHAEIEGLANNVGVGNIMDISKEICNRLNAPEKSEEEYIRYCATDVAITKALYQRFAPSTKLPKIKKVIFNNPATIVIWADETKTVVKAQNNEIFDPEKGLAMAITKKALGNEGNYFDVIKKHVTEYQDSVCVKKLTVDISVDPAFSETVAKATKKVRELAKTLHDQQKKRDDEEKTNIAYHLLNDALIKKKATKADLIAAMEEAIGYLGDALDD